MSLSANPPVAVLLPMSVPFALFADLPDRVRIVFEPTDGIRFAIINNENLSMLSEIPRGQLEVIQTLSSGVDWLLPQVPRGVVVCSARGAFDVSVAEWIIMTILSTIRNLPTLLDAQRQHMWQPDHSLEAGELSGRTVLILGYGSIGHTFERLLIGFNAKVLRIRRSQSAEAGGLDQLFTFLSQSDIVVSLLPETEDTLGLIGDRFFQAMKPGAVFVNAGRGLVVNHSALKPFLASGRLSAALDVFPTEPLPTNDELWDMPNTIITPHIAGSTDATIRRCYSFAREQLDRYLHGKPLLNQLNSVDLSKSRDHSPDITTDAID